MSCLLYLRGKIGFTLNEDLADGKAGPLDPEALYSQYGWALPMTSYSSANFERWVTGKKRGYAPPGMKVKMSSCAWIVVDHFGNISRVEIDVVPTDPYIHYKDYPTGNLVWSVCTGAADQDILLGIGAATNDTELISKLVVENNIDLGKTFRWTSVDEIVARLNRDFPLK